MMMVSDEEKRWIVVGIAMNKVAAPVLRDAVKQGMDTNYANLDRHCQLLHPPCTLKTLTHGVVQADPILKNLKFQNTNNNHLVHGVRNYNFNINSSLDLAKVYLPGYLAQFSAFDDTLDMTAILRLLGFRNYMQLPAAVFSPRIQASADDVRENVRNKWGHVNVTEWTDALFNDCFDKLKTLVRSLGLTADVEKNTLDQLADWQTKGCHLVMGHAVDKELQQEVRVLIKNIRSRMRLKNKKICEIEEDVAILKDESSCKRARLDAHDEHLYSVEEKVQEVLESIGEMEKVLERLESFEGELSKRLLAVEEGLAKTDGRVENMEQSHTKVAGEVDLLKQNHSEAVAKVDQLEQKFAKTDDKVEQMELDVKNWMTQTGKPDDTLMKPFDLPTCRSKLEGHYLKTSTVPTSVWCKKAVVDIHQIYTRLSFVKDREKPPAGTTQSELKHYSDIFNANKNGDIPKRILVQGQTGIGKSTFVKKLLVDWVEVNEGNGDEQAAVLKNFELVVAVNLKEVSKCQSLVDVIRKSNVFAKEDKYMTEGLVDYISNNQEKVLLIFDGYDEYHIRSNSEICEIFCGNSLRSCCVLITTRISKADELRGSEDLHAEITGFSEVDREHFMRRFLGSDEVSRLRSQILSNRGLRELAKVPLLLLFLCTLWKEGKSKHFAETKTMLYMDIIEFVLNHSYRKQSSTGYVEVANFKDILCEMGKVALQGLLKDDHFFRYSQLDSVLSDESVLIGLLQITEFSEALKPVGVVSFIHKSIQEFLAAWYITYRCIPEGGNLGEIGVKLEECLALENVFQFICGLSEDGASTVLRHLKSVRISDPLLDLSKAIPDVENETDEPLSNVTERQEKFRDLVLFSFAEVESKAELSSSCLDSLGNILFVSDSFPNYLLEKAIDTNSWSLVLNGGSENLKISFSIPRLTNLAKIVVTKSSESSTFPKVAEFLQEFIDIAPKKCTCGFFSILCFRNGQVYFYITDLVLSCDSHTRLVTDTVVLSHSEHSSSGQLCLKFLKTIECYNTRCSMESLGVVIKHCNHLERIVCAIDENSEAGDSFCHLLKQVPNPDRCSLSIEYHALTSTGAARLAYLLPRFGNVTCLCLSLAKCSTDAVGKLVAAVKHKTLQKLELNGMNLGSFKALGQSLPELSALQTLSIGASDGCILQLVFPVVSESLPRLKVRGLTECSAEAVTRLIDVFRHRTFEELKLEDIHLTSAVAEVLGQLLPKLSALRTLRIRRLTKCTDEAVTRLIDVVNHKTLEKLELSEIYLTSAVAESLGQSLPELSALQTLKISGSDRCSLHLRFPVFSDDLHETIRGLTECSAEVVSGIVAGIKHKTLKKLEVSKIKLASAVTKLLATITVEHKTLTVLELRNVCLTSAAAKALCQSLPELSALRTLKISGLDECSSETVTDLFAAIQHKTLEELILSEIHLTSAAAEALGQSLPELSALQTLEISGCGKCRLQHGDMEALFGKFNRPSSLKELRITDFEARGSLAQPIQNLSFFPYLEKLQLKNLDIGEADLNGLLKNLKFMPDLRVLHLWANPLGPGIRLMVPYLLEHQNLQSVVFPIPQMCSTKDLDYVQNAVDEKRPQLRIGQWF